MKWRKLGHVFLPDGSEPRLRTHAALPTALHKGGDEFRVYYCARDAANRSSVGFVDIDLRSPLRCIRVAATPVLEPGPPGAFDESGVSASCALADAGTVLLYYLGWNLRGTPWRNTIGFALSADAGASFEKQAPAPLLDLEAGDPHTLSYPWVARQGASWNLWYGSSLAAAIDGEPREHVLKRARSADGRAWRREQRVALGLKPGEIGLSRPCVLRDGELWRMWYSYRGARYRIGYAESADGEHWQRRDELAGIEPSGSGWDSEAVCYPCVFEHGGERYMLYNGNGYGRTGFGIAIRES